MRWNSLLTGSKWIVELAILGQLPSSMLAKIFFSSLGCGLVLQGLFSARPEYFESIFKSYGQEFVAFLLQGGLVLSFREYQESGDVQDVVMCTTIALAAGYFAYLQLRDQVALEQEDNQLSHNVPRLLGAK